MQHGSSVSHSRSQERTPHPRCPAILAATFTAPPKTAHRTPFAVERNLPRQGFRSTQLEPRATLETVDTRYSAPLTARLVLAALRRLPTAAMSRACGRLCRLHLPLPVRTMVLHGFVRAFGVDSSEVELPITNYRSVDELFTRRLRPDCRSWPDNPRVLASPVDAIVGASGIIVEGSLTQAKGRPYSAAELLDDPQLAERFLGGQFATLYLTPRHYHRIHTPAAGMVTGARHIPGGLLPVNPSAVHTIADLFARNERLVCHIHSAFGTVAVVAVGAFNVGRITAAFDPSWNRPDGHGVTNRSRRRQPESRTYSPPVEVNTGAELMTFHLGSTVVLLTEPDTIELEPVPWGHEVRVGEPIGRATL